MIRIQTKQKLLQKNDYNGFPRSLGQLSFTENGIFFRKIFGKKIKGYIMHIEP